MVNVARFLLPEPPREDLHVRRLFVDRTTELKQATAQLAAIRKDDLGRPMVLVGQARVGKSHVLLELTRKVRRSFDVAVAVRVTTGLEHVRDVLRETLYQSYSAAHNAALERGIGPPAGPGVLAPLEQVLSDYSEAIAGTAFEIELGRALAIRESLKRSAGVAARAPVLLNHLAGGQLELRLGSDAVSETTEHEQRRVRVNRFEETHLTDLIAMTHALMREHDSSWQTLIVLDDFDLLRRDEDGSFAPERLLQALASLAAVPGLFVLTTVRLDTFRRHEKVFHRLASIRPFAEDGPLIEVYRRHVRWFRGGSDPFREGFVAEAARLSGGRVGIYLAHLREAFEALGPDVRGCEPDFGDWIGEQWESTRRDEPSLAALIADAARDHGGILSRDQLVRLRSSALMRWVLEDYTSENAARVDPPLLSVLRERG